MKNQKLYLFSLLLLSVFFISLARCKRENAVAAKSISINTKALVDQLLKTTNLAYKDSGWAYVKNENQRLIIYQKTKSSISSTFNRLIVLALDNPKQNYITADSPNDTLFFWYTKSMRQIITYSTKRDKIMILALDDTAGNKLVTLFKNNKSLGLKTEFALGYGLTVSNKEYKLSDFLVAGATGKTSYVDPFYITRMSNGINPNDECGDCGTNPCTSGGVGSSGCSVTNGGVEGGGACSVTCNTGYYACCNDDTVVCNCKVNPKK